MRSLHTDIDDIGDSLVNKGQFTVDKIEIIMKYLGQHVQNYGDQKYFTVKTITVHPDHIASLGSNYTYTVQDDYIGPELPIEFDEEEKVAAPEIEAISTEEEDEDMEEIIAELDNEDTEVTLETELLITNLEITQTNEPTDIDWF
jgi:hypothetical protein